MSHAVWWENFFASSFVQLAFLWMPPIVFGVSFAALKKLPQWMRWFSTVFWALAALLFSAGLVFSWLLSNYQSVPAARGIAFQTFLSDATDILFFSNVLFGIGAVPILREMLSRVRRQAIS